MRKPIVVIALLLLAGTLCFAHGKKKKKEDLTCSIKFLVLRASNGKPVRNAAVVLHEVDYKGRQAKGGYELKTDMNGQTSFDGVPYGKLRVQVLAPDLQTFGQDYDINQPAQTITIKLNPPQKQYSVYDK
jgi:uncharacterized GH25 family protein